MNSFSLRTLGDAASVALAQRLAPGRNTVLLDIEPGDIGALTALQALVRADRAAGRGTPRGNLSLHIDLCRRAALPDTPLRVTTLVKLDQGSEFLTLLDGVEVRDWVEPGKTLEEEAPPCE